MLLEKLDDQRREISSKLDKSRQATLGQFLTPTPIAKYMAGMFLLPKSGKLKILDPGAGGGVLSCAVLDRIIAQKSHSVEVAAYEIDEVMLPHLSHAMQTYAQVFAESGLRFKLNLFNEDYIESATLASNNGERSDYDLAILNPPYGKIKSQSRHRKALRLAGIETVNLYSAFVGIALKQMRFGGQLVAIIPRSFCNGPYYQSFRRQIIKNAAINRIHLFDSRTAAFSEDGVLQENIIIHLSKGVVQNSSVQVTTSSGIDFDGCSIQNVPYERIIEPGDLDYFIHIPNGTEKNRNRLNGLATHSIKELGINVSTGPVVDFRVKRYLRKMPIKGTVPLIYPAHFDKWGVVHPIRDFKKSNALKLHDDTRKWLYPSGYYTLIRRFSSKEEKRRIVARVIRPEVIDNEFVGFENHLNVFHAGKTGLDEFLAYGLAVYLNSSLVDKYFRTFSGHTQVNVTDLKRLKYPPCSVLRSLGVWALEQSDFVLADIDRRIAELL